MSIEVLKEHLSEETYNAVAAELEGKDLKLANLATGEYVSKGKYEALETQLNNTQTLLTSKTTELDELIAKAGDNQALKDEIESLKTKNQTDIANLTAQYDAKLKTSAVMAELTKAGANDPADILPHLKMDAITVTDNGLVGLSEQVEPIKTAKPYLFKTAQQPGQRGASGLQHGAGGDDTAATNKMRAVMGLPPIK